MATDMFLKLDGILGESPDSKHKDEIEIDSFSFGVQQHGSSSHGGGMGAGKASFTDFHFSKKADKASPVLMEKCAKGDHIPSAVLIVRKAGGDQQEFYKIKMSNVLISSFQNAGPGNDSIPSESLTLNFSKLEFETKVQNPDGTLAAGGKGGWDLKANHKV
ncbi:MAG: type VI secretion system tube protein Hcp [Novosphingobium sp.]|nr:type VI secretion system tube protein Hcp [Novosphingobium sp.]